jgi:HK97 family phage major capsid protein
MKKMNVYQTKLQIEEVSGAIDMYRQELLGLATDNTSSKADIQAKEKLIEDFTAKREVLQGILKEIENEKMAQFKTVEESVISMSGDKEINAKADLIIGAVTGKAINKDVYAVLGDNINTGEKILPKSMTNKIVHEPFVANKVRDAITVTSITNLEVPTLDYVIADDDFILDDATAKDMALTGGVISFGRNKVKIMAGVTETILRASKANLVATVEGALMSGLVAKEKKEMFRVGATATKMSFYQESAPGVFVIKEINDTTLFRSIRKAIADLPEKFGDKAKIVMRYIDYMNMIESLGAGATPFFNATPEQILGKPVIFSDAAVHPIVGDFTQYQINYDPSMIFDRDKDVKTGVETFVITAYFDAVVKLKSAFRIVTVTP